MSGFIGAHLSILKQALAIYAAETIDFVDAIVLAIARHNGWHSETFDKELAKLAAAGEPRFERLKEQEEAMRAQIVEFRAEDRLSCDEPCNLKL